MLRFVSECEIGLRHEAQGARVFKQNEVMVRRQVAKKNIHQYPIIHLLLLLFFGLAISKPGDEV